MSSSALGKEIQNTLIRLNGFFKSHDKAVLFGLLLGCVPLFPVALTGMIISLLNLWLWKNKKLEYAEIKIIRPALLIAILNILLGILLLHYLLTIIFGLDWINLINRWQLWFKDFIYSLWPFNLFFHRQGGTLV